MGVFLLTLLGDPLGVLPILGILDFLSLLVRNMIPLEGLAANISRSARRGQEKHS